MQWKPSHRDGHDDHVRSGGIATIVTKRRHVMPRLLAHRQSISALLSRQHLVKDSAAAGLGGVDAWPRAPQAWAPRNGR
jgi:hypothetical protein